MAELFLFVFRKKWLCFFSLLSLNTLLAVSILLQHLRAKAAFLFRENLQMLLHSLEDFAYGTKCHYL